MLTASLAPTCFSAHALDRCDERRGDDGWLRQQWSSARVLVLDGKADALADGEGALRALPAALLPEASFERAWFLGTDDDGAWFALAWQDAEPLPGESPNWLTLRRAGSAWPAFECGLFAYARALALWHQRTRYCTGCGAPAIVARAGHGLRCSDGSCGSEMYPRTDPAVIVLVTDGSRCLLGRQRGWPPGQYSTLAGFVEPGEALEDALRREVAEESGVTLASCHYRGSQPWPFPCSLMIGFRATAADTTIRLGDELEDARWFEVDALLAGIADGSLRASSPVSIAFRLLSEWVQEVRGSAAAHALSRA